MEEDALYELYYHCELETQLKELLELEKLYEGFLSGELLYG